MKVHYTLDFVHYFANNPPFITNSADNVPKNHLPITSKLDTVEILTYYAYRYLLRLTWTVHVRKNMFVATVPYEINTVSSTLLPLAWCRMDTSLLRESPLQLHRCIFYTKELQIQFTALWRYLTGNLSVW